MARDTRFAELQRILAAAGYRLVRIRGSHHMFNRAAGPRIVVPVHRGKVNDCYVRQIKKIIDGR
jgi:predicted RNA binding protein YcfA (HicA-like mRNA interferase family)